MTRILLGVAVGAVLLLAGTVTCLVVVIDDLERAAAFFDDPEEARPWSPA